MSTARCARCDIPVAKVGQTCSLECYKYMYASFGYHMIILPDDWDIPVDLYDQPWYEAEQDKIQRKAEAHEVDPNTFIHEEQ